MSTSTDAQQASLVIRRVRPEEYLTVGTITVAAYDANGYLDGDQTYADELRDTARRDSQAEIWVAADESDTVVGAVTFCPRGSTFREIAYDWEGEFRALAVDPTRRGAGAGEALTRHCVQRSRQLGFVGIAMCSMPQMTAAHRVYQRLGFTRDPSRDWSPMPHFRLWAFHRSV